MWRHWCGRVHKWLGLGLSLWIVLVSLTGTLLLYKTELLQLTYPQLQLSQLPTQADAAKVFNRFDAGYAFLPREDKPWIEVVDAGGTTHYFDAHGDEILARPMLGDWISWAVEFHHHLLLEELGKNLMGIMGLLSLVLVVAGLVRWWPRNWSRRVLAVRWRSPGSRQFQATLWQFHRSAGVVAFIPILVLLLTGTAIMYASAVNSSLATLLPHAVQSTKPALPAVRALNWQQRMAVAKRYWPAQEPRLVYLAPQTDGSFRMRLKHMHEWHPNGRSYLTFAENGSLQTADDVRRRSVGYQVAQMIYPVHIAYVGGLWWFLLALAGGVVLLALPVTGVWFWLKRGGR
ncbi:hypothetical protein PSI9734_01147 [Pseudidiomarina piscicola]|uniref:PepSY domain-containing protein n=1 Tax=Pseudidiomarina piscicola TaxID=2614830 RepID=A0A6S6WL94_9GAMM|nr:PepSY-associated TM helix domain-containing protein [Pseudidiomarina piscicola]CAB0150704.1 hypothetical protein PSI9734_01147 [Pseudidiomarina piscicola]VZT40212.1 hypothetical protein PSI9734_01147 [Pseudomonas aeruginosa]